MNSKYLHSTHFMVKYVSKTENPKSVNRSITRTIHQNKWQKRKEQANSKKNRIEMSQRNSFKKGEAPLIMEGGTSHPPAQWEEGIWAKGDPIWFCRKFSCRKYVVERTLTPARLWHFLMVNGIIVKMLRRTARDCSLGIFNVDPGN